MTLKVLKILIIKIFKYLKYMNLSTDARENPIWKVYEEYKSKENQNVLINNDKMILF